MFWQLLKFEMRFQSRQLSYWFALLMLAAIGFILCGRQVYSVNVLALSAQNLTYAVVLLCQISIFAIALFTSNAALRDHQYDFYAFVETKPTSNTVIVLSRFISLNVMGWLIVLVSVSAMLLPVLLTDYETDILGAFNVLNILWPLLVIVLPSTFFITSILYVCAHLSKSTIMTFAASVTLYACYILSSTLLDSPMFVTSTPLIRDEINLASLLDPFALAPFLEQTKSLTEHELNSYLVSFEGNFLYNRILWFVISVLLLLKIIKFAQQRGRSDYKDEKKSNRFILKKAAKSLISKAEYQPVAPAFSARLAFQSEVLLTLKIIFKSKIFCILMLLVSILVMALIINGLHHHPFVGEQLPFTSIMMANVKKPIEIVGLFMMVFFSGELVWLAREHKFDGVLSATSTPRYIYYFAKVTALASLIILMISMQLALVISYQWSQGFYADDKAILLSLLVLNGLPLLLVALLSLSIQSIVDNKYTGFAIVGAVIIFYQSDLASMLSVDHYLLRFAQTGPHFYSDFSGYDFYLKSTFWFSLYWLCFSILIAIIAYGLSKRAISESLHTAAMRLPVLLGKKGMYAALGALMMTLSSAGYIYYNTNILNQYYTAEDHQQYLLNYEQQLAAFKNMPSPKITDMNLDVAFYPSKHKVTVNGLYVLNNPHDEPISHFLVTLPQNDQSFTVEIKQSHRIQKKTPLNVQEIILAKPLLPGQQLDFTFTTSIEKKGFKNADYDISLLKNGIYFHSSHLLPFIGYDASFEIRDNKERKHQKLAKREQVEKLITNKQYDRHGNEYDAGWINYRATVSTEQGQTPIASGMLERSWSEGKRVYAEYSVDHKISNFLAFMSAAYETKTIMAGAVKLNAFYHKTHDDNINHLLNVTKRSLDYFENAFGPYPMPELNLVEIPNRAFARAYAGTVVFSEHVGFKEDLSIGSGIDHFVRLIAHEVSHLWWGHQLAAAKTEGEVLLIESLAQYSAVLVIKELYGEEAANQMAAESMVKYLNNRSHDIQGETPLYKIKSQRYLRYDKGLVVFNAIRHLIGESSLNNALKQLMQSKGNIDRDYATSLDLINMIKQHADQSSYALIDEWLKQIVTYDLAIDDASVRQVNNDEYLVSVELSGYQKFHELDNTETTPFNHEVELALYSATQQPIDFTNRIVRFENGKQTLTFNVKTLPESLILDPRYMFVDHNRLDNHIQLEMKR